jgi:hypothetical protein
MAWYDAYIGKPWSATPNPPESFCCGELVRYVMRERCGIDMPLLLADPNNLRSCVCDLGEPRRYGLIAIKSQQLHVYHFDPDAAFGGFQHSDFSIRQYDVAFLCRAERQDHVGIAVDTADGLLIMHCQQRSGVILDSPAELLGTGIRKIMWYRHKELLGGAPCPA